MKCDELKFERLGDANETYPASTLIIRKQFVDAAIDELKAENERLEEENKKLVFALSETVQKQGFRNLNIPVSLVQLMGKVAEERGENHNLQYELRATKRALWMARKAHAVAMFSYWDSHYRDNPNAVYRNRTVDWLRNRWLLILDAIIKKEKVYK